MAALTQAEIEQPLQPKAVTVEQSERFTQNDMIVIGVVAVFLITLANAIKDVLMNRNVMAAYNKFIGELVTNKPLADMIENGYQNLTGVGRLAADNAFDFLILLSKLSPDSRDDVLEKWVEMVTDGQPNTFELSMLDAAKKLYDSGGIDSSGPKL